VCKTYCKQSGYFEEFGIELKNTKPPNITLSKSEIFLLDIMEDNSVKSVDYFVEKTKLNISEIISIMMGLVLKGVVIETKDGYRRIGHG
jgi:predicted Rossmann fold nucleotide-binding protein DprA/Smf involved in DNA uptake